MAIDIQISMDEMYRWADQVNGAYDQMPYVMANLLTHAVFNARRVWVESTWPEHVTQRNVSFLNASLRVQAATKHNLEAYIYDKMGRVELTAHAKGAVRTPHSARRFAIPNKEWVRRGSHGVVASMTPAALRVTPTGIFVGEGGRLRLRYVFKPTIFQPKDVPFYEDFEYAVNADMRTGFAGAMEFAMRTRR